MIIIRLQTAVAAPDTEHVKKTDNGIKGLLSSSHAQAAEYHRNTN